MSAIVSKLGIHCNGPRRSGYGEFLRTIAAAGRQLAIVKVRDDFGGIDEPLNYWPNVLTIGAQTPHDRLPFDWYKFLEQVQRNPRIQYWEVLNEDDSSVTYAAKADLYIQLMPLFAERNIGLVVFNCGSGNPPYYYEDGGQAYQAILRVALAAQAGKHDVLMGVHGYGYDLPNCLLRYRDLAAYLRSHNALLPFVLTEFADEPAGFRGVGQFMAWCQVIDAELMRDDYLLGAALWTLGGGWNDYSPALWNARYETSALGDYIATVEAPAPPPPPIEHVLDVKPLNVLLQVFEDAMLPSGQAQIRHATDVEVRISYDR